MRIFLDANIVFSAAKSDGAIRRLLDLLRQDEHQCLVDAYVMEEARRNLAANTSDGLPALVGIASNWTEAATLPPRSAFPKGVHLPEKDLPVLAAAVHHRCQVLVTGDRMHFGPLYGRTIHGVTIHSPRSLAEAVW